MEDVSTYSDLGGSTSARYTGRWQVTAATYDAAGARASVRRDNADGTTGWVEFAATATQVTVNGERGVRADQRRLRLTRAARCRGVARRRRGGVLRHLHGRAFSFRPHLP